MGLLKGLVVKLSILMPSNRTTPGACGRILQACSWACDDIEVVVRDNSGSLDKQRILRSAEGPSRRIVIADPCEAHENFVETQKLARGGFVLFLGDDDCAFDRGVARIAEIAGRCLPDPGIVGITGSYLLELAHGSQVAGYRDVGSENPVARVGGYVAYQGPNLIFYSAIRREVADAAWAFMDAAPLKLPFHDQLLSLIYLLSGRFLDAGRLIFLYNTSNWDTAATSAASDLKIYATAGLDPAVRQLHWLLCGLEGAWLAMFSPFAMPYALEQRQAMASRWFELMLRRFAGDRGHSYGSVLTPRATQLCEKWLQRAPHFDLAELLDDVSGFLATFAPDKAESYRAFWTSVAPPSNGEVGRSRGTSSRRGL
ncbi:MAG TPA: hypothetical protein VME40_06725 [Caulobacteraceae bacterium]|nr:hypothetical protein [Caulobacteraceae bacterium]